MCCGVGLHLLPISLGILSVATFLTTYLLSIIRGDVEPIFPYISDTGTDVPESCIFGMLLNLCAFLSLATIFVRYKLVNAFIREHDRKIQMCSQLSLVCGFLTFVGMMLVANFQEDKIEPVHLTGAGLVFGFGVAYAVVDASVTYLMYPDYNNKRIGHIRMALALMALVTMITTFISAMIARDYWNRQKHDHTKIHWKPTDDGYLPHVISTVAEWSMSLSFVFYYFTYIRDFQKMHLNVHMDLLVSHLDQVPTLLYPNAQEASERTKLLV